MSTTEFHERIDRLEDQLTRVLSILKDPAPPEPLLDVHAVADRLNVSKRTVESLISSGEIKPIRIKGQRRFDLAAIEAYIKRCAEHPTRGKRRRRAS